MSQIDFRFAEDEDNENIYHLVNSYYKTEECVDSKYYFRQENDKLTLDEINGDGYVDGARWVVLELQSNDTDQQESVIIGAARINFSNDNLTLTVDLLSSSGDAPTQRFIFNYIIARIESIGRNFEAKELVMHIPQWRDDILNWSVSAGFLESSGNLEIANHTNKFIKDTMIITIMKTINYDNEDIVGMNAISDFAVQPYSNSNDSDSLNEDLSCLITDLFSALHSNS
eukprot:gene21226-27495_t